MFLQDLDLVAFNAAPVQDRRAIDVRDGIPDRDPIGAQCISGW